MAQADPDPPAEAEQLVRRAVNCVLERHLASPLDPGTCSGDVVAEFLAEVGILALAALSEPVPPAAAIRREYVDLDPRRFCLRLAEAAPARRVSSHVPAVGAPLWHPEYGLSPENNS